jgi:hypothetical protein
VIPQPDVCVPLHASVLIADSVSLSWLTVKTVCSESSTTAKPGAASSGTAGDTLEHPDVTSLLQRAPLITETVLSFPLVT